MISALATVLGGVAAAPVTESEAAVLSGYRMGGTTLRKCGSTAKTNHADPVNVAFIGTHASWQNSQRAVGRDYKGDPHTPGLKWRTTVGILPGGAQSIDNSGTCTKNDAQSSRGSGLFRFLDRDLSGTKRHTRFFEQTIPLNFNPGGSAHYLATVQDAHRDVKSGHCRGYGSVGPLNDRVPTKINGRTDGGYNDAQRLFQKAFPPGGAPFKGKAYHTPHDERFVQCAGEKSPTRYTVGWNGVLQFFILNTNITCQGDWGSKGNCPAGGRTGQ